MASVVDIIASLARLTPIGPSLPAERAAPTPQADEAGIEALPALNIVAPPPAAANTLIGLSPPLALDPSKAGRSLALASFVPRAEWPATETAPNSKPPPRSGFILKRAVQAVEPPLTHADIKIIAAKLHEKLSATPDIYVSMVNPAKATDQRADVFASGILNAAMIPGWPTPLNPQPSTIAGQDAPLAALLAKDEGELLEFAAAMGLDEALSARLAKERDDPVRRKRLLIIVIALAAAIGAVITALRCEVEDIFIDLGLLEAAATPESWGGRIRLPLE